jgi:transcriptional regulator with XRE-family HTH domain
MSWSPTPACATSPRRTPARHRTCCVSTRTASPLSWAALPWTAKKTWTPTSTRRPIPSPAVPGSSPGLADARVLEHRIGARPTCGAVRVEAERHDDGTLVVHNYGHGGAGVTLSWGCAKELQLWAYRGVSTLWRGCHMTMPIGDRIARLRSRRELTQEQLAERAEVSIDTVRRLEQDRGGARMTTYEKIASALDVELGYLLGQPTMTHSLPEGGGIVALRNAVQDITTLPGLAGYGTSQEAPSLPDLRNAMRKAQDRYQTGKFTELVTVLPGLISDLNAATREGEGGADHDTVWSISAAAHIIVADVATQLGHTDLAFMAVERALNAAGRASDPLRDALAVSTLSLVFLRQGRWAEAQAVAVRKASQIEPRFSTKDRKEIAMYGLLLLSGAVPASRAERADDATELIRQAKAAAELSGFVRVRGVSFGPASVGMQATTVDVALKRWPEALKVARKVDTAELPWEISRARHRLDMAHIQFQTGDDERARELLLEIDDERPEWIEHQVLAGVTAEGLLERDRQRDRRLRSLAARLKSSV